MKKYNYNNVVNDERLINALESFNNILDNDCGEFVSLDIFPDNLYIIYEGNGISESAKYDIYMGEFENIKSLQCDISYYRRLQDLEYTIKTVIIDEWLNDNHFYLDTEYLTEFVLLVDNMQDSYYCGLFEAINHALEEVGL